jgi:integrase
LASSLVGPFLAVDLLEASGVHRCGACGIPSQPTAEAGTSVKVVQKVLGHASRKTTSVYAELARKEMDRQLQENAL